MNLDICSPSLNTKSGTVRIVGPAKGYEEYLDHQGEVMAVNRIIELIDADVFVSKETEMFQQYDVDCLKITGDTWTVPGVEHWRLSNVPFSGVFAFLVAKLLGYDRILIFGMPADYEVHKAKREWEGGQSQESTQHDGWNQYRQYFNNTTVFGGNLPRWFPELS